MLHTLPGMSSDAHAAAVALPSEGDPNFQQGIDSGFRNTVKALTAYFRTLSTIPSFIYFNACVGGGGLEAKRLKLSREV